MKNKINSNKANSVREKLIWSVLTPQFVLLIISIAWINISPSDNVFKYFIFNFKLLIEGIGIGFALAVAGYLFYLFTKKTKRFPETVELFEQMLAPTFSNFKVFDLISLSLISGFCEEIFFRGLMLSTFGIVIASIAFGLLHLPGKKFWIYAIWATGSGFILGWLFLISGSLWLPITAHAVNNILGMFMLKTIKVPSKDF